MINLSIFQIKFTQSASNRICKLIKKNQKNDLKFRIYIVGGGCNGFQYQFKLEKKINKNDIVIQKKFTVIIDSISFQYINQGIVDYQETLSGSKFIISNPQAKTTCSCGSSFSI